MPKRKTKKRQSGRSRRRERDEEYFSKLVYKRSGRTRFTQDSPILADVFVHYGVKSDKDFELDFQRFGHEEAELHLDLLITPHLSRTAVQLAEELSDRLERFDQPPKADADSGLRADGPFYIAPNQSVVGIRLSFEELLRYVLPLSWWWEHRLIAVEGLSIENAYNDRSLCRLMREQLIAGLKRELDAVGAPTRGHRWLIQQDAIWAARLFYLVQHSNRAGVRAAEDDVEGMADYFLETIVGWVAKHAERQSDAAAATARLAPNLAYARTPSSQPRSEKTPWTYTVNRNRPIEASVFDSVKTMKADAAIRTFEVRGEGIRWAILDSGIDATHPAFRLYDGNGQRHKAPFERSQSLDSGWKNNTRVKKTYDFSGIRRKLTVAQMRALLGGRMLDWAALTRKLDLELPFTHKDGVTERETPYETPGQAHGTHVAGILGADWRPDDTDDDPLGPRQTSRKPPQPLQGVCPDIELYDLRVFDAEGRGDEFSVISALQFVRWINQQHDIMEIHGVNLSLAMLHEVNNYACGRSPVCEECTRLVGNGVVVVAAAGNDGRSVHTATDGTREDGYRAISIADPGNADAVITVGSTHRKEPHTYGVSYFSSRGPTGDGRAKPDLVAPGEKITSTVPGNAMGTQDGTSQAAPHVSGAAALLMCRHAEFIGQPARIKKILMDSAIDLGRERHFQGAGLVDIFGAMQSV